MNRISFVLDASAAIKACKEEDRSVDYVAWLRSVQTGNRRLLAPHLIRYELGNILAGLPADRPTRARWLEESLLGVVFADGTAGFDHAPPLSYYDAAYLALAQSAKATLVTYDDKLIRSAKKLGVATLSP